MLKFQRFGYCKPIKESFKEAIKRWWYNIEYVFQIIFEVGLGGITINICILGNEFKFTLIPPYRPIYYPDIMFNMLSWVASASLSEHKGIEIQVSPNNDLTLGINMYNSIHTSHAGFYFKLSLIIFTLDIMIYDDRHWDYDNDKYEEYK